MSQQARQEAEEFKSEEVQPHEQMKEPEERELDLSLISDLDASSLEKKINDLSQYFLMKAFDIIARKQKGKKVEESELIAQEDCQKQLKVIMNLYSNLKKSGIISSQASAQAFDESFIQKIKSQKSSVGEIVRETHT